MNLLIINTSIRPLQSGHAISHWILTCAQRFETLKPTLVNIKDLQLDWDVEPNMPATGHYTQEATCAWSELVKAADAILFVVPEYNGSYPASFKNTIDHLKSEWEQKTVAAWTYSPSGAKSVREILNVLFQRLNMNVVDIVSMSTANFGFNRETGVAEDLSAQLPCSDYQAALDALLQNLANHA